jgi:hypothetical protein
VPPCAFAVGRVRRGREDGGGGGARSGPSALSGDSWDLSFVLGSSLAAWGPAGPKPHPKETG